MVGFWFFAWAPNSQKYEHSNEEKNFGDPPYPPKKAYFGRTKAKMGRFSQKGLCYSFEILHGLLTHKNNRIPMKKNFGDPPYPPKKAYFGRTRAKMGRYSQKGFCYSFEILHGLLTNKNIRFQWRRKNLGTPPTPLKKPILGRQKPKWAVSPRRVFATVLGFYMGS